MEIINHVGNRYLVYVDRLSGWPFVDECRNRDMKTSDVKAALCHHFAFGGIPTRIRTDGGLQFASSEFRDLAEEWGFMHTMSSSPHYPQSNGHAEAAVKAIKNLLKKSAPFDPSGQLDLDTFDRGLLEWRNTPGPDGLSSAQILFGRQLRSFIPTHETSTEERKDVKTT